MDQNFQTSFIPKKPVVHERTEAKRPTGLLVIFSVLILLSVFVAYGGVYFYKNSLTQSITSKEKALELARNRFEPGRLSELKTLDRRIKAANGILANHVAPSPIFKILEATTMKTIRYTSFSYELKENGMVFVKLTGEANGYRSIALQSDLLSENKDILDPVFSNLALDTKGSVLFDLTFSVQESLVSYKENLTKGAYADEAIYEPVDTGAEVPLELEGVKTN
ncbi:MAG: hypothetical protein KBC12_02280 [Candidatus Pacebacteria bacterium]|nr:hypothetical protein [Candidatus Paceibacterota bacterium]MBP9851618.1 hypothetical protein [Candidatus Paceibacterota bacterium]